MLKVKSDRLLGSVLQAGAIGGVVGVASTVGAGPAAAALWAGGASATGNVVSQGLDKGFDNIDRSEVVVNGFVGAVTGGTAKGLANKLIPNKNLPSLPSSATKVAEGRAQRMFTTASSESIDAPVRDTIELGIGTAIGAGTQFTNTNKIIDKGIGSVTDP